MIRGVVGFGVSGVIEVGLGFRMLRGDLVVDLCVFVVYDIRFDQCFQGYCEGENK